MPRSPRQGRLPPPPFAYRHLGDLATIGKEIDSTTLDAVYPPATVPWYPPADPYTTPDPVQAPVTINGKTLDRKSTRLNSSHT